jgi:hypothetical protein
MSQDQVCEYFRSVCEDIFNKVDRDSGRIIVAYAGLKEFQGLWMPISSHFRDDTRFVEALGGRSSLSEDNLDRWNALLKRSTLTGSITEQKDKPLWQKFTRHLLQTEIIPQLRRETNVICINGAFTSYQDIEDVAGDDRPTWTWPQCGTYFSGDSHPFLASRFIRAVMDPNPDAIDAMFDCPSPSFVAPAPYSVAVALQSVGRGLVSSLCQASRFVRGFVAPGRQLTRVPSPKYWSRGWTERNWKPFEDFAGGEAVLTTTTRLTWDTAKKQAYYRTPALTRPIYECNVNLRKRGIFIFTFPMFGIEPTQNALNEEKWRKETRQELMGLTQPIFVMMAAAPVWKARRKNGGVLLIELIERFAFGNANPSLAEICAGIRKVYPGSIWTLSLNGFDEGRTFLFGEKVL